MPVRRLPHLQEQIRDDTMKKKYEILHPSVNSGQAGGAGESFQDDQKQEGKHGGLSLLDNKKINIIIIK